MLFVVLVAVLNGPEWLFVFGFVPGVLGCLISSRLSTYLQDYFEIAPLFAR